jgi:hypothetical protein
LATVREFNRLAGADGQLHVHPLVLDVQKFDRDLAGDFVAMLSDPPEWSSRLLADWSETLCRIRGRDEDWLAARLDPWIKHRLFAAWLVERGSEWTKIRSRPDLLDGLAILEQDYHTFTGPAPLFDRLEQTGLIDHRTGPRLEPGDEPEPFVPDLATRAKARARFVVANSGNADLLMDWAAAKDRAGGRCRWLDDPFATEFGSWEPTDTR